MTEDLGWKNCIGFVEAKLDELRGRRDPPAVLLDTFLKAARRVLVSCWLFEQSMINPYTEEVVPCPWCGIHFIPQYPNFTACSRKCGTLARRYPPHPDCAELEVLARRKLEELEKAQP